MDKVFSVAFIFPVALTLSLAHAALAGETAAPAPEKVTVENIKEKYWAQGNESELGVVQNRLYSKDHRFELGLFGGVVSSDPFLSVKNTGLSLGFHLSEYFSVHLLSWKSFVGDSSALTTFKEFSGATTNSNPPRWYLGSEASASLVYGKLSLMGKAIIYYDLHILGGLGLTDTNNGKYITPSVGIGQQVFVHKAISIRLDYRLMGYYERIIERAVPTPEAYGKDKGGRPNWSHVVTLGVSFFFGSDR